MLHLFAAPDDPDFDLPEPPEAEAGPLTPPGTVEANDELEAARERDRAAAVRLAFGTRAARRLKVPKDAQAGLFEAPSKGRLF